MPPPIDDETLVAYLDGELPPQQQTHLEQDLQSDSDLQQRVAALRASWDMLEELPLVEPRRNLAESTIEMVALAMEKDARTWWGWLAANRWLVWAVVCLGTLAAGAQTARWWTSSTHQRILADLPAIVEHRSLQHVDSTEFVEKLAEIPRLAEAVGLEGSAPRIGDSPVPRQLQERRQWMEQLDTMQQGRLANSFREFQRDPRRAQLKAIADWMYASPAKTEHYLQAVRAYSRLLDRLGEKQKALLQKMSVEERVAEIRGRVNELLVLNYSPDDQDREAIRAWLDHLRFEEDNQQRLIFFPDLDSLIIYELLTRDPADSFVTADDVSGLLQRLSAPAVELLSNLANPSAQRYHLGLWVSAVVQSPAQAADTADLEDKFRNLPEARQDELEILPEDEVRRILRQPPLTSPASVPGGSSPLAPPVTPMSAPPAGGLELD
ncbi:MAG: hypothetical protein KDA45_00485 [Planctomycetales bacterium]|nr:hypothetical protein [Planctomycetales bacterium]